MLGLCWIPWVSRGAVLSGLVVGARLAVFTEPVGLVLVEGLLLELPWGRWPLTVHPAGWDLACNVSAVPLVSILTRGGAEREARDRMHDALRAGWRLVTARWSLALLRTFLALGPGAILGNALFSRAAFSRTAADVGVPSPRIWQIGFRLLGVVAVCRIARRSGLSAMPQTVRRRLDLSPPRGPLDRPTAPDWIARALAGVRSR